MSIMLALLAVDRFDLSIAFQVWVSTFMRALDARIVSNHENDWQNSRESALEYLARGQLMDMVARFCDGEVSGVDAKAVEGVSLVRDDVGALLAELESLHAERSEWLRMHLGELATAGGEPLRRELGRVLELTALHRAWFGQAGAEDPSAPADTEVADTEVASAKHFAAFFQTPSHDPNDPEAAAAAHASRFYRG